VNKVLVLAPYPFGRVGSQRFRFEQYWDIINTKNEVRFQSYLDESDFGILYTQGNTFRKAFGVLKGFAKRFLLLFSVYNYDKIFIHREASPIGPPVFEWIIAKIFRKQIIYDFDDAIWLSNTSAENKIISVLKCHWKVAMICKWSWKVTCGNEFLCDFTRQFNPNVVYIPTTLDLDEMGKLGTLNLELRTNITFGWTGTHSTIKYLQPIVPILQEIQAEIDFNFILIADKDPELYFKNYMFIPWNKESEWEDLRKIDIGIMPLDNSEWEEGKCGFKVIQYMALGIPALASPTKANCAIIQNGQNGFICSNDSEWKNGLKRLIQDAELQSAFSRQGRETIETKFSKSAWIEKYSNLFSS
jgi:glycosyltransferase involved in cell wall biosynthesis